MVGGQDKSSVDETKSVSPYSVGNNTVRIHHLKAQLAACRQGGGETVTEYFAKLLALWEELIAYQPVHPCSCGAAAEIAKERDQDKIHQFVMGLDEARFGSLCTQIIATDPLPDLGEIYSKVTREEDKIRSCEQQHEAVGFVAPSHHVSTSTSRPGGKKDKAGTNIGKKKKKETGLGLRFKKDENFGEWYSEVCKQDMIEYYDISGCYIIRPWSMAIWEIMQTFFDAEIKKKKVRNCYFPVFVSPSVLEKEKEHIKGFAPEVAWVTKAGKSNLETHIAIRPTSETVMYPYFGKWTRGHRDLPLKLNQWCNVVRWEFSNPTPFIRSREFLWQEGHTAFATKKEADDEVLQILDLYRRIYEEYLAVPVVKGMKSENEKFAGGLYTTSVEAFIPNTGRGVQGATSHCLGQNFANMFEINFENENKETEMVWQNSWAYSTRTIGVMIMTHGDDKGLVLPPKVAPLQVVVIPVPYKDANLQGIYDACTATAAALCEAGLRAEEDLRDNHSPGWKYSDWEMKGVPLRIEIGPRELENNQVRSVRRDNGVKEDISRDNLVDRVRELLEKIQQNMYEVAKEKREACLVVVKTWDEFIDALGKKKLILAPWCDEEEVEREVKARTKGECGAAKTLCSPFDQPELPEGTLCFVSGKPAKKWTYWGRSY